MFLIFLNWGSQFYIGCFVDSSTDRDLNATGRETVRNQGGSVDWCVQFCIDLGKKEGLLNGYNYAGMQNR